MRRIRQFGISVISEFYAISAIFILVLLGKNNGSQVLLDM